MRALLVTMLCSSVALAQGKTLKDKEEIKFNEIERGFTVEIAGGANLLFNLPGASILTDSAGRNIGCGGPRPFSAGQNVRVEVGADIASRGDDPSSAAPLMVVTAMLQAGAGKAGSDYLGTLGQPGPTGACIGSASGDVSMLAPGLAVKVNIVGFKDSQDVNRLWLYGRLAGGVNFWFPTTLIDKFDVLLQGGVGIEYYTRLRHFALGLEANFQMMFLTTTFGVTITPTLRYSF